MTDRLAEDEMIRLAAEGVGKVDYHGHRGVCLVTFNEIEAMAAALVCLGIKPISPPSAKAGERP